MLFKVISLSIKTGSASFFDSSSARTALDALGIHFDQHLLSNGLALTPPPPTQYIHISLALL